VAIEVPGNEELARAAATTISLNDSKIGYQLNSGDAYANKFLGLMAVDTAALGTGIAIREQLGPFWWALMVLFFVSLMPSVAGLRRVTFLTGPPRTRDDIEAGLQLGELTLYRSVIEVQIAARRANKEALLRQSRLLEVSLGTLIVALLVGPVSASLAAAKIEANAGSGAISLGLILLLAVGIRIAHHRHI
jgi:hypothetical protein